MRLQSPERVPQSRVFIWLTEVEAVELRDALNDMLQRGSDPAWHTHVSSADYQTEVSIAWDGPDRHKCQ
jgi:hypothetical protein